MTKRISITIDDDLEERLRTHANLFATGNESENISKVISGLVRKHIPAS